jgi:hypothetical protein
MTADQCPVCGFLSGQKEKGGATRFTFRATNRPCQECEQDLKRDANELRRFRERERRNGRKSPGADDKAFRLSGHPYLPHREFDDKIGPALLRVAKLVGIQSDDFHHGVPTMLSKDGSGYAADVFWYFSPEESEALEALYLAMYEYGDNTYLAGKERGSDLLLSLQAGEISGQEFDKDKRGNY